MGGREFRWVGFGGWITRVMGNGGREFRLWIDGGGLPTGLPTRFGVNDLVGVINDIRIYIIKNIVICLIFIP